MLKIITPNGIFFEGEVSIINVKTINGYLGILADHMPLVSTIEISKMSFRQNDVLTEMKIGGGILQVQPKYVKILTDHISYIQK